MYHLIKTSITFRILILMSHDKIIERSKEVAKISGYFIIERVESGLELIVLQRPNMNANCLD